MSRFAAMQLSERDRRTLLIGGVVVATLLLVFRGIPLWRKWVKDERAAATEQTVRLSIARQTAQGITGVTRLSDSLSQASLTFAPAIIDGETPAQAAAELAAYVSETAGSAGIQLGGVQLAVDSTAKTGELYKVRVRADGAGDVRGITTFLQLLEGGGAPLLAVRSFSISQSEPGAADSHSETLRASFEVEGLARRSAEQ